MEGNGVPFALQIESRIIFSEILLIQIETKNTFSQNHARVLF